MSILNPTPEEIARGSSLLAPLRPDYNQAIDLADQGAGLRRISDVGVDVLSGIAAIPQGFAALVPGLGGVSQGIGELRQGMGEALYSPQRQAEQARLAQELAQTEGFFDDAGTYLRAIARDPALGVGALAETLPAVFTGGAVARGVGALAPKLSAPVRAAIGEGVVAGALTAGGIGEQEGDYFQRLAGVPAGIATGLISGGSNRLIGKMAQQQGLTGAVGRGLEQAGDIDIALAGGAGAGKGRLLNRMALGGIREGVFEELPQSLSEQAITNVALGEDITEGLGSAAAGGLLLGSAMGAGFTGIRGTRPEPATRRVLPTRGETTELPEAGQEVERLSRAKREGVRTKSGELFKTESAAKAALTRRGDNAADFDIIRTGGGTRENPTIGFTAIRREGAEGVDFETRQRAAAEAEAGAEARQAARATLETELKGIKGIGKKSIDAVLNVKSAAELEALPTSVLSNSRKQAILNSDAFKTYMEQGAIPDFRGTDSKATFAGVPPAEFIDQDTAQQEAAPDQPTQAVESEDEFNSIFDSLDLNESEDIPPVKAKAKAEDVKPKLINLGRRLTSTNFEIAFGTPMANSLDEVYGDPGTTARQIARKELQEDFSYIGKEAMQAVLGAKSAEELDAIDGLSTADKIAILESESFQTHTSTSGTVDAIEKKLLTPDAFKAISHLMRGITPAERDRAKGKNARGVRNTINLVNAINKWLDTDNNAQSRQLVKAFEEFHKATTSYEMFTKAYPSTRMLQVGATNELEPNRKSIPGPDFAAEQDIAFTSEELDAQAALVQGVVSTPPEKSGLGVIPLEARAQRIADAINEIEQLVGRNNLRIVQWLIKRDTQRAQGEVTSVTKGSKYESSPAIRFHIYNRRYREGRLFNFSPEKTITRDAVDQAVEVPGIAPDEQVTYGFNSVVGQTDSGRPVAETNTPRLAKLIDQRLAEKQASTPVGAMLAHYRDVSPSPTTKLLAGHLLKIGERNGFFNNIELIISTVDAETAKAYGSVQPRAKGSSQYTMFLAKDGQNESTVLHEVMHAVTLGALRQRRDPEVIDALNALRSEFRSEFKSRFKIVKGELKFDRTGLNPTLELSPEELVDLYTVISATDPAGYLEPGYASYGAVDPGLDEFVAYGMTDATLQKVLAATPVRDKATLTAAKAGGAKNLWQFFVIRIKALLGIKAVKNSMLSSYMDATSSLLGNIYARSDDSLTAFAFSAAKGSKPAAVKEGRPAAVKAAIDFNNLPPDMVAKSQSAKKKAAENNKAREKVTEESNKFKEEQREKRQEAAAEAEQARFDEVAAGKAETAVPQARGKTKQDVTMFDRLGRTTMNAIANAFGQQTWEQLIDNAGKWSASKFADFVSQENVLSRAVRAVVVGVVDKYGTTEQFRNLLHEYARNRQNVSATAYAAYETLRSMDPNAQQALVDYLSERDDEKLAKALNNPAHVEMVQKTVAGMEELLSEAKRLRVMREGQEDFTLADILALSDNPRYRRMIDRAAGNVGISEAARAKNFKIETQSMDWVITKDGKQLSGLRPGSKFYKMYNASTGDTYFVEQGIDENLVRSKNLVPDMDDLLPYRTEKLLDQADVRMSRRRTVDEMGTERNPVQVVASLTATMQDMSRRIEGARMNAAALVAQESLDADAKWVLDEAPKELAKELLLDAGSKKMDSKELLRKARRPGTWVRIPDDASEWGDLQGKWIAGPAYASMEDYFSDEALVDAGVARTAMRTWKKFKTVYSPVAHMNNVMGNVILSYYHDLPAGNIAQAAQLIINGARGKLTGQDLKLYEEFMASGATLGAFNVAEVSRDAQTSLDAIGKNYKGKDGGIRNLVAVLTEMEGTFAKLAAGRDIAVAKTKKLDAALADIYSNQDNVFRLAAYMTRIQQIRERTGGIDAADKDEAARFAKEAFVDYAITAPWIVAARNSVLPFVAWPYRMAPLLFKLMLTKPWKAAATLGTIHVLNSIFTSLAGDDDDEEGRLLLDDYMQHNIWGVPGVPSYIRMPFGDEDNPVYFGIGRMVPLADVFNLANTGVPQTLAPAGPLYTLFNALNNYDPFLEQEIAGVTDTAAENFWKRFVYVRNDMLPQFIASGMRTGDKLGVLSSEQLGPLGSEPNAWVEISRVLGVNVRQVNMPEQQYKQTQEIRNLRREYGRARSAALRSELRRGNPNVDAIYREMLELNQRQIEALNAELGIID